MAQERLTWNEIRQRYPSQHVGLVDVIFVDGSEIEIESAVVKYTDKDISDSQLLSKAYKGEIVRRYTTLEHSELLMGALTI